MRVAVFSTKSYDREFLSTAPHAADMELVYYETRLTPATAVLAHHCDAVCAFVNDCLTADVLEILHDQGVRLIALRSAGFNHVDLAAAARLGLHVVRVPAYSPHAVAEHAVALLLGLNRHLHRAYARVRDGNFSLEGLLGFDLYRRRVGIVGTGKIGVVVGQILNGFGCQLLCYDPFENPEMQKLGAEYVPLPELLTQAEIITLHCPLSPDTHHLINKQTLTLMRDNVMLINTSRGGLVDTQAVIDALKSGKLGSLGIDVYEEEADLFFEDLSGQVLQDDTFARLLTFPNVLITGHQGFFTREALTQIAVTTLANIYTFCTTGQCDNEVRREI